MRLESRRLRIADFRYRMDRAHGWGGASGSILLNSGSWKSKSAAKNRENAKFKSWFSHEEGRFSVVSSAAGGAGAKGTCWGSFVCATAKRLARVKMAKAWQRCRVSGKLRLLTGTVNLC